VSFDALFLCLAIFVWLGFTTEAATGFGSLIISLTLGALILPLPLIVPLLVPLNVVLTARILLRHHHHADRKLLLRRILPLMGIGMAGGLAIAAFAATDLLQSVFGLFVVAVSLRELHGLRGPAPAPHRPMAPAVATAAMLAAGVIHGIFASGGPLLVYAMGRLGLAKARFRSTLAVVWLTLNATLTVFFIATGRLDASRLPFFAALLPVVALAIVCGEWAHDRLDERRFRRVVFGLLLVAGIVLLA